MSESALRGVRVLVTRPREQLDRLCALIGKHGGVAVELPLFAIEQVGDDAELARELREHADCDGWIFTSANAARRLRELGIKQFPPCFAIGEATADALRTAGCVAPRLPPSGTNSEALMRHPALEEVKGQTFVLCSGQGGRGLIEQGLRARGATVVRLELYRRVAEVHSLQRIADAVRQSNATLCTSGEGLERLWELTDDAQRAALNTRLLVVSSPRVLEIARRLGFEQVKAPTHTSDDAMVDCLIRHATRTDSNQVPMTDDAAKPTAPPDDPKPDSGVTQAGPVVEDAVRPEPPRAPPPPSAEPRSSNAGTVVAIAMGVVILALLGVTGYAGWLLIQERTQLLGRIEAQNDKIFGYDARMLANTNAMADLKADRQETLRKIEDTQQKFDGLEKEFSGLRQQVADGLTQIDRISEEISGGRKRFELAAVEHLLTLANDRLLISGDVRGTLIALEAADARLARLADPQMFAVRAALSEEIAALKAVTVPDIAAATLSLASLIQKVPDLPLRTEAPKEFVAEEGAAEESGITTDQGWDRFVESLKTASKRLVTVRRADDQGVLRLLSPEAETAVYDILTLKLEGARVSMLKGDTEAARMQLRSASGWLNRQFRADDRGVIAMREKLDALGQLELKPELPDISTSLATLRRKLKTDTQ